MSTSRDYCFTSYNVNAMEALKNSAVQNEKLKYIVFQKEVCPTTQRVHYQGYLQLKDPARVAGVKKVLGDEGAHVERRKGTHAEVRHPRAEVMLRRAEPVLSRAEPILCPCCPHFIDPHAGHCLLQEGRDPC